ncbi:hypothetical protein M0813_07300 [Anaeramoeba flamelloides]|uniref:Uncharacterized protein n=1 Tax=Anaeramoeba flamelloides TaxID=1746091 RepID=A0ABQ8XD58_9EUKA|nr:hypothetical protein M0813_07300 [Anaeramoeba flamelloides]
MKETICLNFGKAGFTLGGQLWKLYCIEHSIDLEGNYYGTQKSIEMQGFYKPTKEKKYIPRSIFFDNEDDSLEELQKMGTSKLFSERNVMYGQTPSTKLFCNSLIDQEEMDKYFNCLLKNVEECSNVSEFLFFHSAGGGFSSGFFSQFTEQCVEQFGKKFMCNFTIIPDFDLAEKEYELINTVLCFPTIIEKMSLSLLFENKVLASKCKNISNLDLPTYSQMNELILQPISSLTTYNRFPNQYNLNCHEFLSGLQCYPSIHFPVLNHYPLISTKEKTEKMQVSEEDLTFNVYNPKNCFQNISFGDGYFVNAKLYYRGEIEINKMKQAIAKLQNTNYNKFVNWVPNVYRAGVCEEPPSYSSEGLLTGVKKNVTALTDHGAMKNVFKDMIEKVDKLLKTNLMDNYYQKGIDQDQFLDAVEKLKTLYLDYDELCKNEIGDDLSEDDYEDF